MTKTSDIEVIDEHQLIEIKTITQNLVAMFDEATQIVDFFNKGDEIKRLKKEIKRAVIDASFSNVELISNLQDRFMELAKHKFNKQ